MKIITFILILCVCNVFAKGNLGYLDGLGETKPNLPKLFLKSVESDTESESKSNLELVAFNTGSGSKKNLRFLESVAFDTGYAGSAGLVPQSWVNGNGTSYIYFGSGEFDGQGSGHDYFGTLYMPSSGFINNCDGGRSHTYCDYRQQ